MRIPSSITPLLVAFAAVLTAGCGGQDSSTTRSSAASDEALTAAGAAAARQSVLCIGSPETISGVVVAVGGGDGLTLDTGAGTETVYGLGPAWYWSQNGVDRPALGDSVTAVVTHVTTREERVILTIEVDGQTLALRDPSTCTPLW